MSDNVTPEKIEQCGRCDGKGEVWDVNVRYLMDCPDCKGSGYEL